MYWWNITAPGVGSIIVKAAYRSAAVAEAAERMRCDEDRIERVVQLDEIDNGKLKMEN